MRLNEGKFLVEKTLFMEKWRKVEKKEKKIATDWRSQAKRERRKQYDENKK